MVSPEQKLKASPENLLKMQIPRLQHKSTESETLGVWLAIGVLTSPAAGSEVASV